MSDVDDVGLLDRARRGDADAFSRVFARYQRAIYRYGVYMAGLDAGDDIVQETFLAVLRQNERGDPPRSGSVLAYLIGIARHRILKRLAARHEALLAEPMDDEVRDETAASETLTALDHLTRAEMIDMVRAAVQSLPAAYREAVVLCELQEMPYAQAAEVMQCPIGTVRSRLHRAKTLLAASLKPSGISGPSGAGGTSEVGGASRVRGLTETRGPSNVEIRRA
jgi:RNA polymerase sigma-70 factor (ECF subfamily)